MRKEKLNLDRLVRSAINGTAGEPYCAHILEATGRIDGTKAFPTMISIEEFWSKAASSQETVAEFIASNGWGVEI